MTCAGIGEAGRREYSYTVESVDGKVYIPLPMLVECNNVPSNQGEISTPEKDGCICRLLRNYMFLHMCKTGFKKKDLTQAHGNQMCAA